MNATHPIDLVIEELTAGGMFSVDRSGCALTLGFTSSSGRQIPVYVEPTSTDIIRVHDGGEAWSEIVMEGFSDPAPTTADREKIERLCRMHGVLWDRRRREVFTTARPVEAVRAARAILSVAIALDGWKAWYPQLEHEHTVPARAIISELADAAPSRGWAVEQRVRVAGLLNTWRAPAKLTKDEKSAIVGFVYDERPERVIQRALGWHYDVSEPLVLVMPEEATARWKVLQMPRTRVVPRLAHDTHMMILEAAERVLRAA